LYLFRASEKGRIPTGKDAPSKRAVPFGELRSRRGDSV
jgi:hypothetical protein